MIEKKTANAILEKGTVENIAGVDYQIKAQSLKTLICLSELIGELPEVKSDTVQVLAESLAVAKDCSVVADIVAMLILGADNLVKTTVKERKIFFGLISYNIEEEEDCHAKLSEQIMMMTPSQIYNLLIKVLKHQEIADFFALTTSLAEINILQRTKRKTIVSGQ